MRKSLVLVAMLATSPAHAGTVLVNCTRPSGSYTVIIDAARNVVALKADSDREYVFFAATVWTDGNALWAKAGFGSKGKFLTVRTSLNSGSSVAWRNLDGSIFREDPCN